MIDTNTLGQLTVQILNGSLPTGKLNNINLGGTIYIKAKVVLRQEHLNLLSEVVCNLILLGNKIVV